MSQSLSRTAFATLLLIAFMMGANHVAARLAFDHGVTVATAVTFRSGVTALVVAAILLAYRVPLKLQANHRKALPAIGPKHARSIIASRNARGGQFKSVDDLVQIDGIGTKTIDAIRPYVFVGP